MALFTVTRYVSAPEVIYGSVVVLLLITSIVYHFMVYISSSLYCRVRPYILRHVIYARFYWNFLGLGSTSRSHLILVILYIAGTGICNFVQIDSLQAGGKRAAKLSLINLIPMFLGGSYEFGARILGISLNSYGFLHRSFALVALVEAVTHVIIIVRLNSISWANEIQFYGLLTACMFLALIILPLVKKRVYEIFLLTHLGCAITMIYAIWRHTRLTEGYIWLFSLSYLCTFITAEVLQLARIVYRNVVIGRRRVRMSLSPYIGEIGRITLLLPRPWVIRAGQRVNLGVPSIGIFYLFQSHPFAISWWENDDRGRAISISILLRPRYGFTRRVLDRVKPNKEYSAWIDGPFGPSSVGSSLSGTIGDYGHIFMVATGVGIGSQLPYIKELLDGRDKAEVRTRRISLVWQLDRVDDYESARDLLQMLVEQDNSYMLRVSVYDALQSDEVLDIGKTGLIKVHSGYVNWNTQLDLEIGDRVGRLLVSVSAQFEVRHELRNLVRSQVDKGVDLFEPEFQPWG